MPLAIGVDLGGTNLRVALVEISGDAACVLRHEKYALEAGDKRPADVAEQIAQLVREIEPSGTAVPVTVGVAGMLEADTGIVINAPNLHWRQVDFAGLCRERLKRPVGLENDLRSILWGEHRFGAAKGFANVLCAFMGTGIGSAAVVDGRLYRGGSNVAIELGHTKFVLSGGRRCGCGARGCVEAYAGGRNLAIQAQEQPSAALMNLLGPAGNPADLNAGHLDLAARLGDAYSKAIVDRAGQMLGVALANAVTTLNPQCLILGGTVWQRSLELRSIALRSLAMHCNAPAFQSVSLVEPRLGDDAGVFGSADLALRR